MLKTKIKKLEEKLSDYRITIAQKNPQKNPQIIKESTLSEKTIQKPINQEPIVNEPIIQKPIVSDINNKVLIPENQSERIKVYDLPILKTSPVCNDISIHEPKTVVILTDKAIERITKETEKIDKQKQLKSKNNIEKVKITKNTGTSVVEKQASTEDKKKFIKSASLTASAVAAIAYSLFKKK